MVLEPDTATKAEITIVEIVERNPCSRHVKRPTPGSRSLFAIQCSIRQRGVLFLPGEEERLSSVAYLKCESRLDRRQTKQLDLFVVDDPVASGIRGQDIF